MSKAARDKGLLGEREVKQVFEKAGFQARKLEDLGDHLIVAGVLGLRRPFHVECKRQETLHMDKWSRQAESEALEATIPMVVYRRSREPWRVSMRLEDLLELLADLPKS